MEHGTPLISTVVVGLVLAFIFGTIANRMKMPPLVGYLVAGIIVGPYTPGFVADMALAQQLAELGVILLMFGVGLHFSIRDLLSVRALAVPGSLVRILGGTALSVGLAMILGWSVGAGLILGLALSVASTVVLLKALQDRHIVDSDRGRIAVGWVIVEDLVTILALVLIPAVAAAGATDAAAELHDPVVTFVESLVHAKIGLIGVLGLTVLKVGAFMALMLIVGRRVIPYILHATAHTGSRELFRLAVLAVALGVAAGAATLFGVSLALGAFFAGMILSESELSHRAANETLPLRDAFAVLFFVGVGMLFDPAVLVTHPLAMVGVLLIILFGKTAIAFFFLVTLRLPVASALTVAVGLAQIGEFSFILAALGVELGLLPIEGRDLILGGAIISIILNPVMFWGAEKLRPLLERLLPPPAIAAAEPLQVDDDAAIATAAAEDYTPATQPTALANHTILVGYGRVGVILAEGLKAAREPFVLIEVADDRIAQARAADIEVVPANAATSEALTLANVMAARMVMIAIPNAYETGQAVEQARRMHPSVRIVARGQSDEEALYLRQLGADEVILGIRETAMGMLDWALSRTGLASTAHAVSRAVAEAAGDGEAELAPDRPGYPA